MRKSRYKKHRVKLKINKKLLWLTGTFIVFLMSLFYLGKTIYSCPSFFVKEIVSNVNLDKRVKRFCRGKSLFTLKAEEVHSLILKYHPEYKEAHILKQFPSTLKVDVERREPFAQWKGKRFYILDREGVVIDGGQDKPFSGLIVIEIADSSYSLHKGYRIKDSRLQKAFFLLQELEKSNFLNRFDISLINPTNPAALYFMIANSKVIVGEDSLKRKIYLLDNLIKKKLKSDLSSVEYIDLRHKKIYIGYRR